MAVPIQPAPLLTPVVDASGRPSAALVRWFNQVQAATQVVAGNSASIASGAAQTAANTSAIAALNAQIAVWNAALTAAQSQLAELETDVASDEAALAGLHQFLSGPYDPPPYAVGADGDYYLSSASSVLYGPKAGGAWPLPGIPLGGRAPSRTVSANVTAIPTDYGLRVNAAAAPVTVTTPLVPASGQKLNVKKIDSTQNAVTVAGNTLGGTPATVEGNSTLVTLIPGTALELEWDGVSGWWLI